jgi:hypothetical protein
MGEKYKARKNKDNAGKRMGEEQAEKKRQIEILALYRYV